MEAAGCSIGPGLTARHGPGAGGLIGPGAGGTLDLPPADRGWRPPSRMAGRSAARTLCNLSLRTASGPEGSSAKQLLRCAAGSFRVAAGARHALTAWPIRFSPASGGRSGSMTSSASPASLGPCATPSPASGWPRRSCSRGRAASGRRRRRAFSARALNCVEGPTADPCGECDACREVAEGRDIDVLEIDAATHTQVDNVREVIISGLSIAPVRDRHKVFIIDEVHQLSSSSFNALLKSVEEPPPHVVFIMATTLLDKIPDTILSRSQVFEFRTIGTAAIVEQLQRIVEGRGGRRRRGGPRPRGPNRQRQHARRPERPRPGDSPSRETRSAPRTCRRCWASWAATRSSR